MPVVSKAQNAAMHAAKEGRSTLGIPQKVGEEFVEASQGRNIKALPERVEDKRAPRRHPKQKAPGRHQYALR